MSDQTVTPILWGVGTVRTLRSHWVLHELGVSYDCQPIRPRPAAMERRFSGGQSRLQGSGPAAW
ncbi:hypothetical protein NBRC116589_21480 [Ruegeria sp. HU-ET01832]